MRASFAALTVAILLTSACDMRAANGGNQSNSLEVTKDNSLEVAKETPASAEKPRWEMPPGMISYQPICEQFSAPKLPDPMPDTGVVPAVLFSVGGAPSDEVEQVRSGLAQNGFAVGDGTATINGTEILFGAGDGGVLRTQGMADRLFDAMCGLNTEHVKLVAARYNGTDEANRMN